MTFKGANDPQAPVSQGWLRVSQRKLDPARSKPYRPFHPHDGQEKLAPGEVYEADVEIWPTSIVFPKGYMMALTIGGKDFERDGATGMMKGSGIFMHDSARIVPRRNSPERARCTPAVRTASYLLLPRIPLDVRRCGALNVPHTALPPCGRSTREARRGGTVLESATR